jgi:hypothetical protein
MVLLTKDTGDVIGPNIKAAAQRSITEGSPEIDGADFRDLHTRSTEHRSFLAV